MIEEIRKKLKCVQSHDLSGAEIHIKSDEITYIDHNRKQVYKRVLRPEMENVLKGLESLPVARIVQSSFGQNESEFILEYIEGTDIFIHLRLHPEKAEETCEIFENFLAIWTNFSPEKYYLECHSFDVNPDNFILKNDNTGILKIDYLSDWGIGKKELYFYVLPFIKLIEHKLVAVETVKKLINKRFSATGLTFDQLYDSLQKNFLDTYKSIS